MRVKCLAQECNTNLPGLAFNPVCLWLAFTLVCLGLASICLLFVGQVQGSTL